MSEKKMLVIRTLRYFGDADWVKKTLATSSVKGEYLCSKGSIKEEVVYEQEYEPSLRGSWVE